MKNNNSIKVASYNIRHGADVSMNFEIIASDIEKLGIDIVGFQEIDRFTGRVNGVDTVKILADSLALPYHAFTHTINLSGGEYGTVIFSRYPIVSAQSTELESFGEETRCLGHAEIDIGGCKIDFFNTHVSYKHLATRKAQMHRIWEIIKNCPDFILTGDFNTDDMQEFSFMEQAEEVNKKTHITFPSENACIDNIVLSPSWEIISSGVGPEGHSDHRMLWAELRHTENN